VDARFSRSHRDRERGRRDEVFVADDTEGDDGRDDEGDLVQAISATGTLEP